MREALLHAGRHLREASRSRTLALAGLAFAAVVLLSLLVPQGSRAGVAAGLGLLGALALLALLLAATAGAVLPGDRREGREEWLASLGPSGATRRLGAVLAAGALLLVLLPAAGAVAALAATVAGRGVEVRRSDPLALAEGVRLASPPPGELGTPTLLELPRAAQAGDVLEVETRLLVASREAALEATTAELTRVPVAWASLGGGGEVLLSRQAPLRIQLPAGATWVSLTNHAPRVSLRLEAARLLGAPGSYLASLVAAGLLLAGAGLALAAAAVAVSRATSAPTAAGLVFALAALGLLRGGLADLGPGAARRPGARPPEVRTDPPLLERVAWTTVGLAARAAPDLESLRAIGEPVQGRAIPVRALGGLGPWLLYAGLATALAVVPLPRRRP